jgi:arylsulfatase B
MLAQLDDSVGKVLDRLRVEGLEERTLIFLLSDNGGPTRELTSSNAPLRGEKGQLLEGGIRVPFLVQWKGRLPAGRTETRMASALDLFPTALAAAEIKPPNNLDGVNLLPPLTAPSDAPIHARLYWRVGRQAALREGQWKIHRGRGDKAWQLYNLNDDIQESHELAATHPDRVTTLEAAWKRLDAQMIAPLWGGAARRAK